MPAQRGIFGIAGVAGAWPGTPTGTKSRTARLTTGRPGRGIAPIYHSDPPPSNYPYGWVPLLWDFELELCVVDLRVCQRLKGHRLTLIGPCRVVRGCIFEYLADQLRFNVDPDGHRTDVGALSGGIVLGRDADDFVAPARVDL